MTERGFQALMLIRRDLRPPFSGRGRSSSLPKYFSGALNKVTPGDVI